MDRQTYMAGIGLLQREYGRIGEDRITALWQQIRDWSAEEYQRALSGIMRTFQRTTMEPFPRLPHFERAAGRDIETRSQTAIEAVRSAALVQGPYRSVDYGCVALHRCIESCGGWPVVASWGDRDWQYNRRMFAERYQAYLRSPGPGPGHCLGIDERNNARNGWDVEAPNRVSLPWSQHGQIEHRPTRRLAGPPQEPARISEMQLPWRTDAQSD